jgi:hypothetical protein
MTKIARLALVCALLPACTSERTSNTARTGTEQLLISNSVDQALNRIDFQPFGGQHVYLEEKYLDCTDKGYVLASLRERLMHAGADLSAKAEEADVVLEIRSGGIGTDSADSFLGLPAVAVPGPMPITTPEVRLISRSTQMGTAKIGLVAYDAKTKEILGQGGTSLARSDDNNWYVMGIGPYKNGSLKTEVSTATSPEAGSYRPQQIAFQSPAAQGAADDVQLTGSETAPQR